MTPLKAKVAAAILKSIPGSEGLLSSSLRASLEGQGVIRKGSVDVYFCWKVVNELKEAGALSEQSGVLSRGPAYQEVLKGFRVKA